MHLLFFCTANATLEASNRGGNTATDTNDGGNDEGR